SRCWRTGLFVARRDRALLFFRKKVSKKLAAWISCYNGSASHCKPQDLLCGIISRTEGSCLKSTERSFGGGPALKNRVAASSKACAATSVSAVTKRIGKRSGCNPRNRCFAISLRPRLHSLDF